MDFKTLRKAANMTLADAARASGYTIGAINGQELHDNGSERLKQKLLEVYRQTTFGALHEAAQPIIEHQARMLKAALPTLEEIARLESATVEIQEQLKKWRAAAEIQTAPTDYRKAKKKV